MLAGLASGDSDAAAAFIRRFQGRVFGLARTIVGDPETAEEVAQETFVRAWRHAGAYDPRRGRVSTWLLTITRNLAVDVLRLRHDQPMDPEAIARLQLWISEPGPEERQLAVDETRLRSGVRALPEEQRRALLLAAFYGWTAREISESEKIPLGTVKTRIRTALLKLRSALEVADE